MYTGILLFCKELLLGAILADRISEHSRVTEQKSTQKDKLEQGKGTLWGKKKRTVISHLLGFDGEMSLKSVSPSRAGRGCSLGAGPAEHTRALLHISFYDSRLF